MLIDSTSNPSFTPGITSLDGNMFKNCENLCQNYKFGTGPDVTPPIVSWDSNSGGVKISTSNFADNMKTYDVILRGTLPASYRTNCVYYMHFFSF
jgi:hypothetical protein